MRATPPYPEVPGDNYEVIGLLRERIMARSGDCLGMNERLAVWRFGFLPNSEAANAYGVAVEDGEGFLWILATRKTGKVRASFRGYALDLPREFRTVIDGPDTRP